MLVVYEGAHGTWWQRFTGDFNYPQKVRRNWTNCGFCKLLSIIHSNEGVIIQDTILGYLRPFATRAYGGFSYWFKPGDRKSRIKLLKRAIKVLETEIKIHGPKSLV
jgi:hypothetical protein